MMSGQLKYAFFLVWIILSIFILFILITPFVFSKESIHLAASKIKIKHENSCVLCGMTTSFIKISKGEFGQSHTANKFGIYIVAFLLVNEIIIFYILIRKLILFRQGKLKAKPANKFRTRSITCKH